MTARVPQDCLLRSTLLSLALLAGCSTPVWYSGHRVALHGQLVSRGTGHPVRGQSPTVVFAIRLPVAQDDKASPAPEARVMRREGDAFSPSFLVVRVGATVRFENGDGIYHGFFSSSEVNPFELGKLSPGTAKEFRFDQPGWTHVYCSLHAGKQATILVTPNRHFAIVDSRGRFRFEKLAPGRYVLETWREGCRPHRKTVAVSSSDTGLMEFVVDELSAKGS